MKGAFIPKLLNNPLAPCSSRNCDVLLLHTAHFHKSIIRWLLSVSTFGFSLSVFFLHFKQ